MANTKDEIRNVDSTEFFWENMSMLGFSNPSRALVMSAKETIDNSLDSAEEIGVLPEIEISYRRQSEDVWLLRVSDNAAGIPPESVKGAFGDILYSSRFDTLKQTRGQQGIGVSAVHTYSQKHVGDSTIVTTKERGEPAYRFEIRSQNKQAFIEDRERLDDWDREHGTEILVPLKIRWTSRQKLLSYLRGTSIANPAAKIKYERIDESRDQHRTRVYDRQTETIPPQPEEMLPHPNTIDIGSLEQIIDGTTESSMTSFLQNEFCRLSSNKKIRRILRKSSIDEKKDPSSLTKTQIKDLVDGLQSTNVRDPEGHALAPMGHDQIEVALSEYNPEFSTSSQRSLQVIAGHPTKIEIGIAWGGEIENDGYQSYRVANKVPLVYGGRSCAINKGIQGVNWGTYDINTDDQGDPTDPMIVFVHLCSTGVQFGNEAKTYLADTGDIVKEIELAIKDCGRDLRSHLREKRRKREHKKKVQKMIPVYLHMRENLESITSSETKIVDSIARSCNTIFVDEERGKIRNPTDSTRTITLDEEKRSIDPKDQIDWDGSEIEYGHYPLYSSEIEEHR